MSLAYADAAYKKQATRLQWILLYESASGHAGRCQSTMSTVKFKVGKFAMLISLRNSRSPEQALIACTQPAIAARNTLIGNRLPAGPLTKRTNIRCDLHDLGHSYFDFAPWRRFSQVESGTELCRCCADVGASVEGRGKDTTAFISGWSGRK